MKTRQVDLNPAAPHACQQGQQRRAGYFRWSSRSYGPQGAGGTGISSEERVNESAVPFVVKAGNRLAARFSVPAAERDEKWFCWAASRRRRSSTRPFHHHAQASIRANPTEHAGPMAAALVRAPQSRDDLSSFKIEVTGQHAI